MSTRRSLAVISIAVLCAGGLAASTAAEAAEVTIDVLGVSICGEVKSEGEGFLEIETAAGTMTVPLAGISSRQPGPCTAVTATEEASKPKSDVVRLVGSNTIGATLMPDLVERFLETKGYAHQDWGLGSTKDERVLTGTKTGSADLQVSVRAVGSGEAFKALAAGDTEIGMASRPANEKDLQSLAATKGVDLLAAENEHVLGLDGLAIIVNEENPITMLTLNQIADIFAGKITNWQEVGGKSAEIIVYARDAESGTFSTFRDLVLGKQEISAAAERFDSSTSLSNAVSSDPDGIGFISLAYVKSAKALEVASAYGISYAPNDFNVRTEDYALARRLFLYTAGAGEEAAELIDFSLSSDAAESLVEDGFVPLDPVIGTPDYTASRLLDVWQSTPGAPSDRYSEMLIDYGMAVRNANRLSATFRFVRGSADIDSRGVRDVDRVVAFAATQAAAGMSFNFIGFTDDEGSIGKNIRLAKERATSVADKIAAAAAAAGVTIDINQNIGVGPVAPVTCNASDEERQKNRRVEIWLTKAEG